jgi:putative flippase GtrA
VTRVLRQVTGYAIASAVALAADIALLWILVEQLHWHYLAAAAASFLAGAALAYILVTRFVFDYRRISDRRLEFSVFATVGLIGLGVNLGIIHTLVEYAALPYLAAKVAAAGATFAVNFVARRWLLFTRWARPAGMSAED